MAMVERWTLTIRKVGLLCAWKAHSPIISGIVQTAPRITLKRQPDTGDQAESAGVTEADVASEVG